jgi:hypothetical protein
LPVTVELYEDQPAWICLRGMRGEVLAASGPWRSSGAWWEEDAWRQDEWELAVDFGATPAKGNKSKFMTWPQYGIYRIYYDVLRDGWFVRGLYD